MEAHTAYLFLIRAVELNLAGGERALSVLQTPINSLLA